MDLSVALNSLISTARYQARSFSARHGLGFSPTRHRPQHRTMDQQLIGRPLSCFLTHEASFADGRLNALTVWLLDSPGVRYEVVYWKLDYMAGVTALYRDGRLDQLIWLAVPTCDKTGGPKPRLVYFSFFVCSSKFNYTFTLYQWRSLPSAGCRQHCG